MVFQDDAHHVDLATTHKVPDDDLPEATTDNDVGIDEMSTQISIGGREKFEDFRIHFPSDLTKVSS